MDLEDLKKNQKTQTREKDNRLPSQQKTTLKNGAEIDDLR